MYSATHNPLYRRPSVLKEYLFTYNTKKHNTWEIISVSCHDPGSNSTEPQRGITNNFTYLLNLNFRYNFFLKLQCKYTCITFNIILYHSSSVLLHLGKYPHMYTYTYANHMYTCPYVTVIKRPDILQIIIQYSAEILWLYSYRPFTNIYKYACICHPKVFNLRHTHPLPSASITL